MPFFFPRGRADGRRNMKRPLFKYQIVDLSAFHLGRSFNSHSICGSFRSSLSSLRTLHSFLPKILRYGFTIWTARPLPKSNHSCEFSLYANATNLDDNQKLPLNTDIMDVM